MSTDKRPVFLNLFQISLPITALVSILHRVSGVVLIFSLPVLAYIYYDALGSQEGFALWQSCYDSVYTKLFVLVVFAAFFYHVFAGLRHIWHDFSGDHELSSVQKSAVVALIAWLLFIIAVAYRIFLGA